MGKTKETTKAVLDVVGTVDLEQVLDIAELVASFAPVPGLPVIVKLLRMLVKVQPQIKKGAALASERLA